MDYARALEVLRIREPRQDGRLSDYGIYCDYEPGDSTICLDGHFTAEELEAYAAYMRHWSGKEEE